MILGVLGLLACSGGDEAGPPVSSPTEAVLPTPATTPSTGATEPSTVDTAPPAATTSPVAGLSWAPHEGVGSFAVVSWTQEVAGEAHVAFSFDAGEWHTTPPIQAVAGANEQLVVGIPYGATADWKVVALDGEWPSAEPIVTAAVPDGLPLPRVTVSEAAGHYAAGRFLLTSVNGTSGGWTGGTYWTVFIDRQGRYVWARPTPSENWTLYATVAQSGDHLLIDEATAWSRFDQGAGSQMVRATLDAEGDTVPMPGLHHAFLEHADGTLAWGSILEHRGEQLMELAPGAETPVPIWDCFDDWPEVGENFLPRCESNSLWYDADRGTYLYSFYTNDSMVELDRATGETLWWAGAQPGGFVFDPPESTFEWQHGINWTEAGTLLLTSRARTEGLSTKVYEYAVDTEQGVLTELWSYDAGVHASTNGDVRRLPDGTTLFAVGSAGQVHEVAPDGTTVWLLDFQATHLVGRAEWVTDLYTLLSSP